MQVVLLTDFAASRKEPLIEMMNRVHQGFADAGLADPVARFNFADPMVSSVSPVDRAVKRHPELERFITTASPAPGIPGIRGARRISNGPLSNAAGEMLPYETLQALAAGVPRSLPFGSVSIHFHSPAFGEFSETGVISAQMLAGILLSDNWWVNGRQRSLSACTMVEGDTKSKKLPPLPEPVMKVFAACGKVRKTVQAPLPTGGMMAFGPGVRQPNSVMMPSADPDAALAVQPIVQDFRARIMEIAARAAMPHDLPMMSTAQLGETCGPMKPALDRAFKAMGYSCKGGSGSFTLRRKTAANLTAELDMDVGTWGHSILAMYKVWGLGFKATLTLPVSRNAVPRAQYRIGNAEHWQQIVENLAALVAELDRTFVPALEVAAGPSPEWYEPEK